MAAEGLNPKFVFLQNTGTSLAFDKMRRRGAIPPPFQTIQIMAEMVLREYADLVAEIQNAVIDAMSGVRDAEDDPRRIAAKQIIEAIRESLRKTLKEDSMNVERIDHLARQFLAAQESFFRDFRQDADDETNARVIAAFTRDEVFSDKLESLRKGYIDSAVKRIGEGKSDLRKKFISMFDDWLSGKSDDLDGVDELLGRISEESLTFAKFFARDQMSRFSRALTVASYDAAGAKWIKWLVVNDGRTRKSHRALSGKIFRIDDLPSEYLDYNCRCSYLPIYRLERSMVVSRGDGISLAA